MVLQTLKNKLSASLEQVRLPAEAKDEIRLDRQGLPPSDPGIDAAVEAATDWLCRAQDHSASGDGGVARDYSLVSGWASSYPETVGYIVPTMFDLGRRTGSAELIDRGRRMVDWLVSIQLPGGGFQGGKIDATPVVPVTFNTGQILLGLAAASAEFGETYLRPMHQAAAWLRDSLDPDGCWRKHPTPFAEAGEKTYETHVSWGLFEADRVAPGAGYAEAALRNVRWAIGNQRENGWFDDCCLDQPQHPLTHTIGYALRGIVEAYRHTPDEDLLGAATRTADALVPLVDESGFLAGRWHPDWTPAVDWVCLTGSVQIAHSLLLLSAVNGRDDYRAAGRRLNRYVRRTIKLQGPDGHRGGIKGAFPVDGDYGRLQFLNWAAKFFIDSNLCEQDLAREAATAG